MNKIAFLLCMFLALCGHLRHRLQSSFATIGRALFVALACLVLASCGGPSEEELAAQAEARAARQSTGLERLRTLIKNGEYCEAQIDATRWFFAAASSSYPNYGLVGELTAILAIARKGCLPDEDESKTWACAEGHSCR